MPCTDRDLARGLPARRVIARDRARAEAHRVFMLGRFPFLARRRPDAYPNLAREARIDALGQRGEIAGGVDPLSYVASLRAGYLSRGWSLPNQQGKGEPASAPSWRTACIGSQGSTPYGALRGQGPPEPAGPGNHGLDPSYRAIGATQVV